MESGPLNHNKDGLLVPNSIIHSRYICTPGKVERAISELVRLYPQPKALVPKVRLSVLNDIPKGS